jgi:hypothetical protein
MQDCTGYALLFPQAPFSAIDAGYEKSGRKEERKKGRKERKPCKPY